MRWAEGMTVMTKPDVIDMLREYERLRRWRRTKAFFDLSRSPLWQAIKRSVFERRTLKDLDDDARKRVREELDKIEEEIAQAPTKEDSDE